MQHQLVAAFKPVPLTPAKPPGPLSLRGPSPMADIPVPASTAAAAPKVAPAPAPNGSPPIADGGEAAKIAAEAAKRPAKAAEAAAEKTAETAQAAAHAGGEILRTHVEAARTVVQTGLETGAKSFEDMTRTWTRALGIVAPDPQFTETSTRNLKAVSEASKALAKGAQDASRAWLELTQKTVRTNVEALGQFAQARSLPELMALQSNLVRGSFEQAIAGDEEIARLSAEAIREATRAIQPPA
jgi:phasin family protein